MTSISLLSMLCFLKKTLKRPWCQTGLNASLKSMKLQKSYFWCFRCFSTNNLMLNICSMVGAYSSVIWNLLVPLPRSVLPGLLAYWETLVAWPYLGNKSGWSSCSSDEVVCCLVFEKVGLIINDSVQSLDHCPLVQIFWHTTAKTSILPGPPCFRFLARMLLQTYQSKSLVKSQSKFMSFVVS